MYNFLTGGEQYKYATHPIIVTIPEGDPHYADHCTDYHYISQTKINLSKKLYEMFGIHLDWHTFMQKVKGQTCWTSSEVKFWLPGEDISAFDATHTLAFCRPFSKFLQKRPKIELFQDDLGIYWLKINGDL
jgi:hypothetical protein